MLQVRHDNVTGKLSDLQYDVTCKIEVVYCFCHIIGIRFAGDHGVR